jgi:DNA-binding GntR family transcriptional regulator
MSKNEVLQRVRKTAKEFPVGARFTEEQLMSMYGLNDRTELREALQQAQKEGLFIQAPMNYVIQEPKQ